VDQSSNSSLKARRRTFCARTISIMEIFFAYLCTLLVESACVFPALWLR
jgi:hypothetical protein